MQLTYKVFSCLTIALRNSYLLFVFPEKSAEVARSGYVLRTVAEVNLKCQRQYAGNKTGTAR